MKKPDSFRPLHAPSSRRLTARQQKFVEAYAGGANASQAARAAGYKDAKNQGYRLRHNPFVAVAIRERLRQALENEASVQGVTEEEAMTPEQLVRRASHMANASLRSFVFDDEGHFSLSLDNPDARRDIAMLHSFKCIITKRAEGHEQTSYEVRVIDRWPWFQLVGQWMGVVPVGEVWPKGRPKVPFYPTPAPVAKPKTTVEEDLQALADMLGIPVEMLPKPTRR